jgi:lipoate-protein ligase A
MSLPASADSAIRQLQAEKYDTWQWNFGSSPKFATSVKRRFSGGLIQVHLTVQHGCIADLQIFGDFLALEPLDPVLEALRGCPYEERSILLRLQPLTLSSYLGAITAEELTAALLNN